MYNTNSYKVTVARGRRNKLTAEEVETAIGGSMAGVTSVLHLSARDGTDKLYHKDEIVTMVSAMFGAWNEGRIKHNVATETAAMRAIAQGIAERKAADLDGQIADLKSMVADRDGKYADLVKYARHLVNQLNEVDATLSTGGWGAKKRALAILKGIGASNGQ